MVLDQLSDLAYLPIFAGKDELRFDELMPELRNYLDSQFECIKKVLQLESYVFHRNPGLKTALNVEKKVFFGFFEKAYLGPKNYKA